MKKIILAVLVCSLFSCEFSENKKSANEKVATGVVGPHKGSKAREVLIPDLLALEHFLSNLRDKGRI